MEFRHYEGRHQLPATQLHIAEIGASAPPENGFKTRVNDRFEGDTRLHEVDRIIIEGCMMDRFTFGCLKWLYFDTGRSICMDVLKEEIDRL